MSYLSANLCVAFRPLVLTYEKYAPGSEQKAP